MRKRLTPFLLCVKNDGYEVCLELRKVYRRLRDADVERHKLVRIIDESGEDYLFPAFYFVSIEVPRKATRLFASAS